MLQHLWFQITNRLGLVAHPAPAVIAKKSLRRVGRYGQVHLALSASRAIGRWRV